MERMCVALFTIRAKAEPVKDRLVRTGINAEIHDETKLGKLWFLGNRSAGARLEVPSHQLEAAEKMLRDWSSTEGELAGVIHCPECRSLRVQYPQLAYHSLLTNLTVGIASELGFVERDFYCEDCHFTWPKEGERPRRDRPHMAPYYFIEGIEQSSRREGKSPVTGAKAA